MSLDSRCDEHSGCIARIISLEKADTDQWSKMSKLETKMDSIFSRLNVILGGVVVACVMLALNIIIK